MAESIAGSVVLDVILRTRGEKVIEHVVGEITVPVRIGGTVDPLDMDQALGLLARPAPVTRKARRKARR